MDEIFILRIVKKIVVLRRVFIYIQLKKLIKTIR